MRIAIIGGGIAGLTQGIFLRKHGFDVNVYERTPGPESRGHAFLMSQDGIELLESLNDSTDRILARQKVDLFSLKRPDSEELIKIPLNEWNCLKRVELIQYLTSFYTDENLKYGHEFADFIYDENSNATSVVFTNGATAQADVFIAADGSRSAIREHLFGPTNYSPIQVKEIVGISQYSPNSTYKTFQKIQCADKGLAFGFIPATANECVWFMQYDVRLESGYKINEPADLKEFCFSVLADFPQEVKEVLNNNDFSTSYTWNTRDFDLLNTFHKRNIVLIGDAAHLSLPFTSAGTTNAIRDAAALTEALLNEKNLEDVFNAYYTKRSGELAEHINQGRELKKIFLEPDKYSERGFLLPLISQKYENQRKEKPLAISYFTDPICSTCWIFQPLLRKLHLEYDHAIDISYRMGGLLPDWPSQQGNKIKSPTDAAKLWNNMGKEHNIPMSGEVWINDPLTSSYPPSLAFKAAQLQDDDKALSFLRKIKEQLFIEKKNISNWEHLETAALLAGLDSALLKKDIEGRAKTHFENDLALAKKHGVTVFPTLMVQIDGVPVKLVKGYQTYETIEELIRQYVPSVQKATNKPTPEALFQRYSIMTEKEFCFLLDLNEGQGRNALLLLESHGIIQRIATEHAEYWEAL
jgi:2-polyprenyl-6-methoxyphenol hydroxylase-like FAD-dependent oxidoreductase/predicted DsbA family dithiol-disulfide isomerase